MTTDKNGNCLKVGNKVKVVFDFDSSLEVFNGAKGVLESIDKYGECNVCFDAKSLENVIKYNRLHNSHWKTDNPFCFYGDNLVRVDYVASLLDNE